MLDFPWPAAATMIAAIIGGSVSFFGYLSGKKSAAQQTTVSLHEAGNEGGKKLSLEAQVAVLEAENRTMDGKLDELVRSFESHNLQQKADLKEINDKLEKLLVMMTTIQVRQQQNNHESTT